jgi:di/tricarboxylate transporter
VALLIMSSLIISGVITPEEGVAGFSNKATITVAFMFV